jgi:hypothetical protein
MRQQTGMGGRAWIDLDGGDYQEITKSIRSLPNEIPGDEYFES